MLKLAAPIPIPGYEQPDGYMGTTPLRFDEPQNWWQRRIGHPTNQIEEGPTKTRSLLTGQETETPGKIHPNPEGNKGLAGLLTRLMTPPHTEESSMARDPDTGMPLTGRITTYKPHKDESLLGRTVAPLMPATSVQPHSTYTPWTSIMKKEMGDAKTWQNYQSDPRAALYPLMVGGGAALLGGAASAMGGPKAESRDERRRRILKSVILSGLLGGGAALAGTHLREQGAKQATSGFWENLKTQGGDILQNAQQGLGQIGEQAQTAWKGIPQEWRTPILAGGGAALLGGATGALGPDEPGNSRLGRILRNMLLAGGVGAGAGYLAQQGGKQMATPLPADDPGPLPTLNRTGQIAGSVGAAAALPTASMAHKNLVSNPEKLRSLATNVFGTAEEPDRLGKLLHDFSGGKLQTYPGAAIGAPRGQLGVSPRTALTELFGDRNITGQDWQEMLTHMERGGDNRMRPRLTDIMHKAERLGIDVNPRMLESMGEKSTMSTLPVLRKMQAGIRRYGPGPIGTLGGAALTGAVVDHNLHPGGWTDQALSGVGNAAGQLFR